MRSRSDFLQGLVAGVIAGLGLAALLRSETGQRMLAGLQNGPQQRPYASDSEYLHNTHSPILLRERPERGGNPDRDMPVVVVIVGEHHEDFLAGEEGRFAVRKLFRGFGQGGADFPHSLQLFFGGVFLHTKSF